MPRVGTHVNGIAVAGYLVLVACKNLRGVDMNPVRQLLVDVLIDESLLLGYACIYIR